MLSQFTKEAEHHITLSELYDFPKDVYSVGRLDKDSEGLLILTNDKRLNHKLLNPKFNHKKTYHVQVEGIPDVNSIEQLKKGVGIKLKKTVYRTKPAEVSFLENVDYKERVPPVRFRKNIPTSWLSITISEGKNRQVRKMCASIGFPCLRLIRASIESIHLHNFSNLDVEEVSKNFIYKSLCIKS